MLTSAKLARLTAAPGFWAALSAAAPPAALAAAYLRLGGLAVSPGFATLALVVAAIVLGMVATRTGSQTPSGEEHNYRETVSIWFRSLLIFQPDVEAMAASTWQFKVHILVGFALIALIPFSRLVHAFTVPLHYLFRPYVVYRSRDAVAPTPSRSRVRGWDAVGTKDRERK